MNIRAVAGRVGFSVAEVAASLFLSGLLLRPLALFLHLAYGILEGKMNGGKRPLGYTIIEVMIVLAISGVMFVVAAQFISGRQARTAFTEGTNELASQLQTIIAQVANGQYSSASFTCGIMANHLQIVATGGAKQGTNSNCIFLGKFIHFSVNSDPTNYEIFSLAGARTATSLSGPLPTGAVATPITPTGADLTLDQQTPQSLNVKDVQVTAGGSTFNSYGLGFVQSLGSLDAQGNYKTGSQTINMVYSPGLNGQTGFAETAAANAITNNLTPATSATICLTDGSRYARLVLGNSGGNGDQLAVTVQVVTTPC